VACGNGAQPDGQLVANSDVQMLRCSRSSLARILGNVEEYFGAAETQKVTELDRLQLVGVLGTGSFGVVRLCRDMATDRHYALKCMNKLRLQCNSMMTHLLEEKQAMANANSPFVVRVPELCALPGSPDRPYVGSHLPSMRLGCT
jgi:hypothetical protein